MNTLKDRVSATKKIFRTMDDALDKIVYMDQPDRLVTSNVLRKANEELQEMIIRIIKENQKLKNEGRNTTPDPTNEG